MIMEKVLFVIPAYNEETNIKRVLDEIKKEAKYADVIVINDSSTDNTKQIVKKCNVRCIDSIFNMHYAWAVQTGLKYAYQNNYDYVIQFDGDGQHIASEATRLLDEMKKSNVDIVIGSRFLNNTGYNSNPFRRIGTKIFEILIRIFCGKRIADPLSGFQCLNRKVIEKYAKMGEYPEYPDANLIIEMLLSGYKIKEVSVKMRVREDGISMHSGIVKPIKYMFNMFYTIFFIIIQNVFSKKVKKDE